MSTKTQAEIDKDRTERWANSPFTPSRPGGNDQMLNVAFRIASALEYIAAQLGQINARQKGHDAAPPEPPKSW